MRLSRWTSVRISTTRTTSRKHTLGTTWRPYLNRICSPYPSNTMIRWYSIEKWGSLRHVSNHWIILTFNTYLSYSGTSWYKTKRMYSGSSCIINYNSFIVMHGYTEKAPKSSQTRIQLKLSKISLN